MIADIEAGKVTTGTHEAIVFMQPQATVRGEKKSSAPSAERPCTIRTTPQKSIQRFVHLLHAPQYHQQGRKSLLRQHVQRKSTSYAADGYHSHCQCWYALENEDDFLQKLRSCVVQTLDDVKPVKKRIAALDRRASELNRLLKKLYEDYVLDRIRMNS